VVTFHGSGIQTTPSFTVTATWQLAYALDCSSFGKGNF
jgi:predicted CxxxxCH...CXXCH cytochrome family protein